MPKLALVFTGLMFISLVDLAAKAEPWPQFRGGTGSGISTEKNLPIRWSDQQGILWETPLIGRGNSSPAVTAKRVDLTTKLDDGSLLVLSYDRESGKLLQKIHVGDGSLEAKGPQNLWAHRHNSATPSPVADEEHIWAFFGTGLLVCVDANSGDIVWKRDLVKDYGRYDITFGMGSSPRLWGDLLIVNCMTKGPSYVVALEKKSGREVWKVDRELPAKNDGPDAYSTPTIANTPDGPRLLVSGSDHVNAYAAKTGRQLWVSSGLTIESPYGRIIAAPQFSNGVVVATTGNPGGAGLGHMIALRTGGNGDITKSHRLWKFEKRSPDSSSPVIYQGRVFSTTDAGIATCLDLKTGTEIWEKRLAKGPYHASIVGGDDKIYFLGIEGNCVVTDIDGNSLATNQLTGTFYATPAISQGVIYLRAYETLYAVGRK